MLVECGSVIRCEGVSALMWCITSTEVTQVDISRFFWLFDPSLEKMWALRYETDLATNGRLLEEDHITYTIKSCRIKRQNT